MENIFPFNTLRFLEEQKANKDNEYTAFILKMVFIFVILIVTIFFGFYPLIL